jgi:PIN domain nuclease of toxin-antitoxin system
VKQFVLDASALLAAIRSENGAQRVASALDDACIGAVNYAEVGGGLIRYGNDNEVARAILDQLGLDVMPVNADLALAAGLMRSITDRFCLALGRQMGAVILTADRQWVQVSGALGVEVEMIR